MTRIHTLKPNVTREEAIQQFSPQGPLSLLRNSVFGPLRSVAELYIPFRLFTVEIVNRGFPEQRVVALDLVNGTLDLYQFEKTPAEHEIICLETRNCPAVQIADDAAAELAVARLRRIFYTKGFFRLRDLRISAVPIGEILYMPYWIAFRGSDARARVTVIDAVRRRIEGAKMRRLVEEWLSTKS